MPAFLDYTEHERVQHLVIRPTSIINSWNSSRPEGGTRIIHTYQNCPGHRVMHAIWAMMFKKEGLSTTLMNRARDIPNTAPMMNMKLDKSLDALPSESLSTIFAKLFSTVGNACYIHLHLSHSHHASNPLVIQKDT